MIFVPVYTLLFLQLTKQCPTMAFALLFVSEWNKFSFCLPLMLLCQHSRSNVLYCPHTTSYLYEPQVYIVAMKPAIRSLFLFLMLLQNTSFILLPGMKQHRAEMLSVTLSVTSCLSLPARVHRSGYAVSKRKTNLSLPPPPSTITKQPNTFVDVEFICVKNKPPEAFLFGCEAT